MSAPPAEGSLVLRDEAQLVALRKLARAWAVALAFSLVDQTKIVTAVSELGRNLLIHGGGGEVTFAPAPPRAGRPGLAVAFVDHGPGIADAEQALRDGFTTGRGLGLGLGGARRLMQHFALTTTPGGGTTVQVSRWR